jgi:hypothetical protein
MRVDELEHELQAMTAEQAPVAPGWDAVRRRHRRRRAVQIGTGVVVVVALVATAVALRSSSTSSSLKVVTTPDEVVAPPSELARCFSSVTPDSGPDVVKATRAAWPSGVGDLLVTTDGGGIYVLHEGQVTMWAAGYPNHGSGDSNYLWARWGDDGSIYASALNLYRGSALEGDTVSIDRLTSTSRSNAVNLPFTIARDVPAGVCPIDGYLAGFSIGPEGYLLLRHRAGVLQHSCPALAPPSSGGPTTTDDPWRCASAEDIETEPRTSIDRAALTRDGYGAGPGHPLGDAEPVLADSTRSGAVVLNTASDRSDRTLEDFGATPSCCASVGGRADAYALSPTGDEIAGADGSVISVSVSELHGPGHAVPVGPWRVSGAVSAMAWSGDWLAVVHGDTLSLLSTRLGQVIDVAHLGAGIRDLDWSR